MQEEEVYTLEFSGAARDLHPRARKVEHEIIGDDIATYTNENTISIFSGPLSDLNTLVTGAPSISSEEKRRIIFQQLAPS